MGPRGLLRDEYLLIHPDVGATICPHGSHNKAGQHLISESAASPLLPLGQHQSREGGQPVSPTPLFSSSCWSHQCKLLADGESRSRLGVKCGGLRF